MSGRKEEKKDCQKMSETGGELRQREIMEGVSDVPLPSLPAESPFPRPQHPATRKHRGHKWITLGLLLFFCTGEGHIHRQGRPGHRDSHPYHHGNYPPSKKSQPPAPHLDTSHSSNVTVLADKTAILNCRIHNINNYTVSWIRHSDIHLLTVGRYSYTKDERFSALHEDDSNDWFLKINYAKLRDSGVYECQVSTNPPLSHYVHLRVVKPHTRILGGSDLHLNTGSTINLTCLVEYSPEPPGFIYWSHNTKIISYDSSRGGVTVILEKGNLTTSTLLIQKARPADSGHYDCSPSNAAPATVTVHVLDEEHPAAMQHDGQTSWTHDITIMLLLLVILAGL